MRDLFTEADCDKYGDWEATVANRRDCISLKAANAKFKEWLSQGTPINGFKESEYGSWNFGTGQYAVQEPTHTALLVCVEEIEQDSERKVLEDLVTAWEDHHKSLDVSWPPVILRAKKLLGLV